jgi:hypothetical protein
LEVEKYIIAAAQGTEWKGAPITDAGLISVVNQNIKSWVTIGIMMKYFNTSVWQVEGPFRYVEGGCLRHGCGRLASS